MFADQVHTHHARPCGTCLTWADFIYGQCPHLPPVSTSHISLPPSLSLSIQIGSGAGSGRRRRLPPPTPAFRRARPSSREFSRGGAHAGAGGSQRRPPPLLPAWPCLSAGARDSGGGAPPRPRSGRRPPSPALSVTGSSGGARGSGGGGARRARPGEATRCSSADLAAALLHGGRVRAGRAHAAAEARRLLRPGQGRRHLLLRDLPRIPRDRVRLALSTAVVFINRAQHLRARRRRARTATAPASRVRRRSSPRPSGARPRRHRRLRAPGARARGGSRRPRAAGTSCWRQAVRPSLACPHRERWSSRRRPSRPF